MTTPNPIERFEDRFPVSLCWPCGKDMTYDIKRGAWECTCGFTLNEGFCQITHAAFENIIFVEGVGLAKQRGRGGWRIVGLQHRWD
jgi:hypothetical protein